MFKKRVVDFTGKDLFKFLLLLYILIGVDKALGKSFAKKAEELTEKINQLGK